MDPFTVGLDHIAKSPHDGGLLELIVRRPRPEEREALLEGELDVRRGLVGDSWETRGSPLTADGSPHPDMQLNIMNSRVLTLIAREKTSWALTGAQLFVDMDLSLANLPPGTRLLAGSAIIEVTPQRHTSCKPTFPI
jgi:hypothetical protein